MIPLLIEQAMKSLKCDKSFKQVIFTYAVATVNTRFNIDFTVENVENHYRTLKTQYVKIKKAKELSGAGQDDATKMITLYPIIAYTYTKVRCYKFLNT